MPALHEQLSSFLGHTGLNSETARLPYSSFDVPGEVSSIRNHYFELSQLGLAKSEIIQILLEKTRRNLIEGWKELIDPKKRSVFTNDLEIVYINGKKTLVSKNDPLQKPLSNAVSEKERDGAPKRAALKTEEFFKNRKLGFAVLQSPEGKSGITVLDKDGKPVEVTYTDSYINIFEKTGKDLIPGATFRTNLILDQCEELNRRLGIFYSKKQDQFSRAIEVIDNAFFCQNSDYSFGRAVATILEINPQAFGGKNINQILMEFELRHTDDLDQGTWYFIARFEESFKKFFQNKENFNLEDSGILEKMIGQTILDMFASMRRQTGEVPKNKAVNYEEELHAFQKIIGCVGGTSMKETVQKKIVNGVEYVFAHKCGVCGAEINAWISKGYRCKNCGQVYQGVC